MVSSAWVWCVVLLVQSCVYSIHHRPLVFRGGCSSEQSNCIRVRGNADITVMYCCDLTSLHWIKRLCPRPSRVDLASPSVSYPRAGVAFITPWYSSLSVRRHRGISQNTIVAQMHPHSFHKKYQRHKTMGPSGTLGCPARSAISSRHVDG